MLRMALAFLVLSLIAAFLGFGGVALAAANAAKIVFMIFVVLFILSSLFYMSGITLKFITWAFIFLFIAVVAGALGFTGIAYLTADIAQMIFGVFIVLFIISMVLHLIRKV